MAGLPRLKQIVTKRATMGASSLLNLFLSFLFTILIASTLSTLPKTSLEMQGSTVNFDHQFLIPYVENIIDSRFKLLAAEFQDQLTDLKSKAGILETSKTTNMGVFEHNHKIHKRQTNASKPTRPFCENSSSLCTFFYPDHPDAGRKKGSYSSTVTNEIFQNPTKVKGAPSSCKDLQLLGHKLNGLYLIKTSQPNQATKIETVFCDFESPNALNDFQSSIGNVDVKTKSVHFYVQRNTSFSKVGSLIPFDLERLNEGGAFDLTSGVFMAPVAGIYHFDLSVLHDGSHHQVVGIQLQVNGVPVGVVYASSNSLDVASLSSSLRLKVNDRVSLVHKDGGLLDNNSHHTHFTGWLVEEDLI